MSTGIETRLRRAYLANGGTAEEFELKKSDLLGQYRDQATITAALEEATKPLTMNDLIRNHVQESRDDDGLLRLFGNQKGDPDVA